MIKKPPMTFVPTEPWTLWLSLQFRTTNHDIPNHNLPVKSGTNCLKWTPQWCLWFPGSYHDSERSFNKDSLSVCICASLTFGAHTQMDAHTRTHTHQYAFAQAQTDWNTQAFAQSHYYLCRHSFSNISSDSLWRDFVCVIVCVQCAWTAAMAQQHICSLCIRVFCLRWDCLHSKEWRLVGSSYFCQLLFSVAFYI